MDRIFVLSGLSRRMVDGIHVVTGALGYSGRWIAKNLIDSGANVRTLTNAKGRHNPFGDDLQIAPLDFDDSEGLVRSLSNADVLYNTYWVRYKKRSGGYDHSIATRNSMKLFEAAQNAGVKKVVHFSVSKPHNAPNWPYFIGKSETENFLIESGLNYTILRPTLFFGGSRNVLVNNIAWLLRNAPIFGVFGDGSYPVQPVHIQDVAKIAIESGQECHNNVIDVAGPEIYTYREFVLAIKNALGITRMIVPIPPRFGWLVGKVLGTILRDDVITMAEINGLMQGLMSSDEAPNGQTRFSDWVVENCDALGLRYQNDLKERTYNLTGLVAPQA